MSARDYSIPQGPRPSFTRSSLEPPTDHSISSRRRMRLQVQTDLYVSLDCNPRHKLIPCSSVYELEDRSEPSISSF
jgi:hypothetical protein